MSFRAKWGGSICGSCEERIGEGDEVEYDGTNQLVHVQCPELAEAIGLGGAQVCPSCFLTLPVSGVCEECE